MHSQNNPVIEICVDSIEAARAAQNAGATRIELCSSLIEGGITPYLSLLEKVCSEIKIPVHVIIRPRGGDFLYSDDEFELMKTDIKYAIKYKADGIVFGILNENGTIDKVRCEELIKLSKPLKLTFHRAFDMTADPFFAMEEIMALGFDYILTSGQHQAAEDGLEIIRELVKRASNRIEIIAAGSVNASNCLLLQEAGVKEFHFSSRIKIESKMKFKNKLLQKMSVNNPPGEYENLEFDKQKISDVLNILHSAKTS